MLKMSPTRVSGRVRKAKSMQKGVPVETTKANNPPEDIESISNFIKETTAEKSTKRKADESVAACPPAKKAAMPALQAVAGTEGRCGDCLGCKRQPCSECSHCKTGDATACIDLYCMNQRDGQAQREATKEQYLLSLSQARIKDAPVEIKPATLEGGSNSAGDANFKRDQKLSISEQIDAIMEQLGAAQKKRQLGDNVQAPRIMGPKRKVIVIKKPAASKKDKSSESEGEPDDVGEVLAAVKRPGAPKGRIMGVYGGSSSANKSRRCGECEGCMRDDCGDCVACADKPRFGGKGTKKKACLARYCRMKAQQEKHPVVHPEQTQNVIKVVVASDGDIRDAVLDDGQ